MMQQNEKWQDDAWYWYWLVNIAGVGRKWQQRLLAYFQTPKAIFMAKETEFDKLLKPNMKQNLLTSRKEEEIKKRYEELKARNIQFLWPGHEEYPEKLLHLYDYPYGIYVKGKLPPKNQPAIAIVGARNATLYGKETANYMAQELAVRGCTVISGLARGIDGCAHTGALQKGGYTLGILGCGINICYPKENYEIFLKYV